MASESGTSQDIGRIGGQFLASLNHEIRTPLSGILGMADLLLETNLTPEQQEYVGTTRHCANQLMEMLNAALEYAALSAGTIRLEKEEFHLPQTLASAVEHFVPIAKAKGLNIACSLDAGLPEYVVGDALRLRQALSPLVANAVKFTLEGQVEVSAATRGSWNGTAKIEISVRDTGIGIPPEKLDVIFDPFRQMDTGLSRSHSGIGLGLAVARRLAERMDGSITAESTPGLGSTFRLLVPLDVPHHDDAAAESAADEGPEGRYRVLLVDDNEVARRVVTHLLAKAGYLLECAEGGEQAVQAASTRHYDVILMDMQMPRGNGLDATAAIRRLPGYAGTPVLALTANCSEEFMRTCLQAGCAEFLSKPIQRQELVAAIERQLR